MEVDNPVQDAGEGVVTVAVMEARLEEARAEFDEKLAAIAQAQAAPLQDKVREVVAHFTEAPTNW